VGYKGLDESGGGIRGDTRSVHNHRILYRVQKMNSKAGTRKPEPDSLNLKA